MIYLILKRAIDLVLTPILILFSAPIILIAAILIRLESKGAAIFVQDRVGARYKWQEGRIVWQMCTFRCYKLRTMRSGSDQAIHRDYLRRFRSGHLESGPANAPFKLSRDCRITRIGQILRRTSLDELPQLWNVLKGDMSLVGPRPVPIYEVEMYEDTDYDRLSARPGITGVWQVYGRSRVTFEQMLQMDREYVKQSSILYDLKLIVLTVTSVLSSRGAA